MTLVLGLDPVLRDAAHGGLLADSTTLVSVRHEVRRVGDSTQIRRLVVDSFGVVEDATHELGEGCVTCAIREDAVRTSGMLARSRRWTELLYSPPTASTALPFCTLLDTECRKGGRLASVHLGAVAVVVAVDTLEWDLLGSDLLADRDMALSSDDRRSVGEVLAALVGHADLVVVEGASSTGSRLVEHLRAFDGDRRDGISDLTVDVLTGRRHHCSAAIRRVDPRHVRASGRPEGCQVWTLDLHSDRPFHPERLLANLDVLGGEPVRSRGRFWLPDRPDSLCAWDGAGAQLSIGDAGPWQGCAPSTRLVFTGVKDVRSTLVSAFDDALATPEELRQGPGYWVGSSRPLEPWI